MNHKLAFQNRLMYRLKRDMGIRVSYYQPITNTHNIQTGEITRDYTVYNIRRALVFETKQIRDFVYDLSFIASNKNFTTGGFFDKATRVVVIERKDFPSTFLPNLNDHIFVKHRKYQVKEFGELEDNTIIAFKVQEIKGLVVREFHTISVESVPVLGDSVS